MFGSRPSLPLTTEVQRRGGVLLKLHRTDCLSLRLWMTLSLPRVTVVTHAE